MKILKHTLLFIPNYLNVLISLVIGIVEVLFSRELYRNKFDEPESLSTKILIVTMMSIFIIGSPLLALFFLVWHFLYFKETQIEKLNKYNRDQVKLKIDEYQKQIDAPFWKMPLVYKPAIQELHKIASWKLLEKTE